MEYFNKLLRKGSGKKPDSVNSTPVCHRTFTKENCVEAELVSSQHSTPKKIQDCDTESDTTAEYESAGEASPYGKEPNLSALADCLAGIHLSTPDKKIHSKLNHFPFSPISAEDETDEEVTAIISNNSQSTIAGSLSLLEEEISPKINSSTDGKNTPFVVISSPRVIDILSDSTQKKIFGTSEQTCSKNEKADSFRIITDSPGTFQNSEPPKDPSLNLSVEEKDKPNLISPTVEFQDAGPACSFHSEVMNSIEAQLLSGTPNTSLISNNSLIIEGCRHTEPSQQHCATSSIREESTMDEGIISEEVPNLQCNSVHNKTEHELKLSINEEHETQILGRECVKENESHSDAQTSQFLLEQASECIVNKLDNSVKDIEENKEKVVFIEHLSSKDASQFVNVSNNEDSICLDKSLETAAMSFPTDQDPSKKVEPTHFENSTADVTENKEPLSCMQHMDIKCPFSPNPTNISENVLRLANEKHPGCLEELPEALGSQIILEPEEKNSLTFNDHKSSTEENENIGSGISISEMCNLIETTFNSPLKENLDEICGNIVNTNLKPSLLLGNGESEETDILLQSTSPGTYIEVKTSNSFSLPTGSQLQGDLIQTGNSEDVNVNLSEHVINSSVTFKKITEDSINDSSTNHEANLASVNNTVILNEALGTQLINSADGSHSIDSVLDQGSTNENALATLKESNSSVQSNHNMACAFAGNASTEITKENCFEAQPLAQGSQSSDLPHIELKMMPLKDHDTHPNDKNDGQILKFASGPIPNVENSSEMSKTSIKEKHPDFDTETALPIPAVDNSGGGVQPPCGLLSPEIQIPLANFCSNPEPSVVQSIQSMEVESHLESTPSLNAMGTLCMADISKDVSALDICTAPVEMPCKQSLNEPIIQSVSQLDMTASLPSLNKNDCSTTTKQFSLVSEEISESESTLEFQKEHSTIEQKSSGFIDSNDAQDVPPNSFPIPITIGNVPCEIDKNELLGGNLINNQSSNFETKTNEDIEICEISSIKVPNKNIDTHFQTISTSSIESSGESEIIDGIVNMNLISQGMPVVSEQLNPAQNCVPIKESLPSMIRSIPFTPDCDETNEGSSLPQISPKEIREINTSKLFDDETLQFDNSVKNSLPLTSAENGTEVYGVSTKSSANGADAAEISPHGSTSPILIKDDMATENEERPTCLNRTRDLSKSITDRVMESKLNVTHNVLKLDALNKSTPERQSYEDLLDRCSQQEKLLGFDESIKEEAIKVVEELNKTDCASSSQTESNNLPSPTVNISEAGPVTADEDINKGVIFEDAANFDFDYLSKIRGKPGHCRNIRESLYLKFDPLASSSSPDPEPTMEKRLKQHPDSSSDVLVTPPRPLLTVDENQLVNITPIAVHSTSPANSNTPIVKRRPSSGSNTPTTRQDFLSKEISKLQDLMLKQELSYQEQIAACFEEIEELKQKLAEHEAELSQHELEERVVMAEAEAEELRKLVQKTESEKDELLKIVQEYDIAVNNIIMKKETESKQHQTNIETLTTERDEASQHLRNMEIAFNDVHQKYEKCKEVISLFQQNEAQYKLSLAENEKTIQQQRENYQKLKEHASQKLEEASNEIVQMKKAHESEMVKLGAMKKKLDIQVKCLEESLEQKKVEVDGLTKICNDLITKFAHK